jgi:transcriptional regulator with XRE-family HTH domain
MEEEKFIDRIKFLMKREGIDSQYAFSKRADIDYKVVNNWFTGVTDLPKEKNLLKISKVFHVSVAWLRYGEKQYRPTLHSQAQFLAEEIAQYGPEAILKCRQLLKIFFAGEPQRDTSIQKTGQKGRRKTVKVV